MGLFGASNKVKRNLYSQENILEHGTGGTNGTKNFISYDR